MKQKKTICDMKPIFNYIVLLLTLLFCLDATAQVNQWRDIYEAKKKDTVFGIARKYGISVPDLLDANPEMKVEGYELKKGDTVFIPFEKGKKPNVVPVVPKTDKNQPVTTQLLSLIHI